jgi:aryl-alcohol dehydrogenase-like predicted oxidoreductase
MHFGEPLDEERLISLLRPDTAIPTLITADVYGEGGADEIVGRALDGLDRDSFCLIGAVGHDFYAGERDGAKGFPRFTDPSLRRPPEYRHYLTMATERSLERCGVDRFDVLLLHNPDRTGYSSEAVWDAMRQLRDEGMASALGVAPGPANGFTLDLIECFERHGALVDWAMIILNPLEPWPGELCLDAAIENRVKVITRVVDCGGLFWGDVKPGHEFDERDHRSFRPGAWVEEGNAKIERMLPIAQRHGLTPIGLACQWNLAHEPVVCTVPTLMQEAGAGARPVEDKRVELGTVSSEVVLTGDEVAKIRTIGDNTGCMPLKGAAPDYDGPPVADRWPLTHDLTSLAERWRIDPRRDLVEASR